MSDGTPQRAPSPSPRSRAAGGSPSFMRPTAAAATRAILSGSSPAAQRPSSSGGSAFGASQPGASDVAADIKIGGNGNAEARAQALHAVHMRSQLRQQRIRERVEQASTTEAAYMDPAEQWDSYMARCGKWSPGGRGRKPSPERLRLAHQTATRIFSEAAAAAEEAIVANVGPHEAAAAVAAIAGSGPPELHAPIVDSHGLWVGEKVQAALNGAAGASSAALWRKKDAVKLEQRRYDFMARAADKGATAASGMAPTGDEAAASAGGASEGVAGLSSQSLYKNQRERSGLLDEAAPPKAVPAGGRLGAEDSLLDTREVLVDGAVGGQAPRRAVAGMTSGEIVTANTSKARGHGAFKAAAAGDVAGASSFELAAASTELRLESTGPKKVAPPHQRIDCEAKAALTEGAAAPNVEAAALAVVSNAPSHSFDGAAGMCSAQVHKARSDGGQRRHTNPLDEHPTADAAHNVRPPSVPRLSIEPGTYSIGGSPDKTLHPKGAANAPLAAVGGTALAQQPAERFAGQKSNKIAKPTNAWEARHVWSEKEPLQASNNANAAGRRPGSPRGGFGAQMSHSTAASLQASGGAGMTSGQLASKSLELRLEAASPGRAATHAQRRNSGAAAVAAASAAGGDHFEAAGKEMFAGAAGLTSGKICEIGPGQANKFDAGSPRRIAAAERRQKENAFQSNGRMSGEATGAAGLTSHEVATKAISEQSAVPKPLSSMAANAAHRSEFAPGGGIQRSQTHASPSMLRGGHGGGNAAEGAAFSGAAGMASEAVGKEIVKREFMEPTSGVTAAGSTPRRGQASPTLRRGSFNGNSSTAARAAIFGGGEDAPSTANAPERLAKLGIDVSSMGHGLSSQQVALNRLVSRTAHGEHGGKRSTSEPRRRPGAEGDAGSLIYGNAHALMSRERDAIGQPRMPLAAPAAGMVAGRSSSELAMPREERRLSRQGNAADNLRGLGGLGGFMTAGGGAPHTEGNAGRRPSIGGAPAAAQMPFSPARACSPRPPPQRESVGSLLGFAGA